MLSLWAEAPEHQALAKAIQAVQTIAWIKSTSRFWRSLNGL